MKALAPVQLLPAAGDDHHPADGVSQRLAGSLVGPINNRIHRYDRRIGSMIPAARPPGAGPGHSRPAGAVPPHPRASRAIKNPVPHALGGGEKTRPPKRKGAAQPFWRSPCSWGLAPIAAAVAYVVLYCSPTPPGQSGSATLVPKDLLCHSIEVRSLWQADAADTRKAVVDAKSTALDSNTGSRPIHRSAFHRSGVPTA